MDKKAKIQFWYEFATDLICLIISNAVSFIALNLILQRISEHKVSSWVSFYALLIIAFVINYLGFHANINLKKRSRYYEMISVLQNSTLTYLTFLALVGLARNPVARSLSLTIVPFVLYTMLSAISRYFLKRWYTGFYTESKIASMVGVLTVKDRAEEFVEKLQEDWSIKVTGVALLDNFCDGNNFFLDRELLFENGEAKTTTKKKISFPYSVCDVPVIATDIRFLDWIRSAPLDEVFINLPFGNSDSISEIITELESMGITVHINLPSFEKIMKEHEANNFECETIGGYPMATVSTTAHESVHLALKRLFDIAGGLLGCIISAPIILLTAIPLLIESPGPLFFKQKRIGKNGRVFNIYKLRSMYVDAEARKAELMEQNKMDGLMFKMDNDPRITKVGRVIRKLSIDELPQFFNVLKGDMSLVGTRPPTVDEFEQYESHHKRRLSMRPGITGMWQTSGRSNIQDFEEIVKLDCKYIDEWSLWLDIKLLLKTVKVVLKHEGAE